ncbi:hypothetical protein [Massilia luteola]|uniref:hypothetical protein n=1 Tax=Massilia luteola TaxID=3081751 RepID=UPI002ACBF486|nr:hypothetical protein [Massilia sp. Gc5]
MTSFVVPEFDIHSAMMRFRLASRELFNNYFRTGGRDDEAWQAQERFSLVEEHLFDALVTMPAGLPCGSYGKPQERISLALAYGELAPWMLNRELDSGYWDHAQTEFTGDAVLSFVTFFDWDLLDVIDWRYVRVIVRAWPSHPELAGKHALVETIYLRFTHSERVL